MFLKLWNTQLHLRYTNTKSHRISLTFLYFVASTKSQIDIRSKLGFSGTRPCSISRYGRWQWAKSEDGSWEKPAEAKRRKGYIFCSNSHLSVCRSHLFGNWENWGNSDINLILVSIMPSILPSPFYWSILLILKMILLKGKKRKENNFLWNSMIKICFW